MMDNYQVRSVITNMANTIEQNLSAPAEAAMDVALAKARLGAIGIRF